MSRSAASEMSPHREREKEIPDTLSENQSRNRQIYPGPSLSLVPPSETVQNRLESFVEGNLGKRITLKDLADYLGYSEKYSSEFFRLHVGMSFAEYVKHARVRRAKLLLTGEVAPISHIAAVLGFSDVYSFGHFFKRAVGCSPTGFRNARLRAQT